MASGSLVQYPLRAAAIVFWSALTIAWLAVYLGIGLILLILGIVELGAALFGGGSFWHRLGAGAAGLIFLGLCSRWFEFGAGVVGEMVGGYAAIWRRSG